ncbi:MAG: phosphate ABC transporter ATP-binding protein PstB [Bacillota bacterium]
MQKGILVQDFNAWYGSNHMLKNVNIKFDTYTVTAIIGPSGCGKSTLIRCINRLHEVIRGARVAGRVLLNGQDVYGFGIDPVNIRRRIGMVFQKPNPFPTMSIFDNVAAGLRINGLNSDQKLEDFVERSLRLAFLWDEVSDRLHKPATILSGGQQQRLCIARALAVEPEVLLMDEPCSALDPASTLKIEELIGHLKESYSIVIVTHNMQQAARVADNSAFILNGEIIEYGPTSEIFTTPRDRRTEDYITGRFG